MADGAVGCGPTAALRTPVPVAILVAFVLRVSRLGSDFLPVGRIGITVGVGSGKARRLRTRARFTVTFLLIRTVAGPMARFPAVKAGVFGDVSQR